MELKTFELVRELKNNGFTSREAESIVRCIMIHDSDLVTKDFLQAQLSELKTECVQEIARVEREISRVEREVVRVGNNVIRWAIGLQIGGTGLVLGLIYFLHLIGATEKRSVRT